MEGGEMTKYRMKRPTSLQLIRTGHKLALCGVIMDVFWFFGDDPWYRFTWLELAGLGEDK